MTDVAQLTAGLARAPMVSETEVRTRLAIPLAVSAVEGRYPALILEAISG